MGSSKLGNANCPCCGRALLQPNGAFLTCGHCGLAITTQALAKAVLDTHDPAALESDSLIVTISN